LAGAVTLAQRALLMASVDGSAPGGPPDPEIAAWAVLGAVEQNAIGSCSGILDRVFDFQRADGQLPVAFEGSRGRGFKLAAWLRRAARARAPKPHYEADLVTCMRQQALLVWACAELAVRTGDAEVARRWRAPLEAAVAWLERQPHAASPDVCLEALAHQARMALGHLSILLGDAVTGARHWAAAAASKARIQAASLAALPLVDRLWATVVGACEPLTRAGWGCPAEVCAQPGLLAWAAAQSGDCEQAQCALLTAAREALSCGHFKNSVSAGLFLRGVACWRRLTELQASHSPPTRSRQWTLSEDEARILSAC
jgi:hypothetical protein